MIPSFYRGAAVALKRPPLFCMLLACTLILYWRRPDAFKNPQFWAEDGYFFSCNYTEGPSAILQPYNGYLHLVPRLIAATGSAVNPLRVPAYYVFSALFLTLYVAARTQSRRIPFNTNIDWAFAVVLVPDCPDGLMNVTNLQFILAGGLVLTLVSKDPKHAWEYCHDISMIILLGLTGPFSVTFAPFFLARAWVRRSTGSCLLAAVVLAAAGVQLYAILTHPLPPPRDSHPRANWLYVLSLPGARIGGSLFAGRFLPPHLSLLEMNLAGVVLMVLVAFLATSRLSYRLEAMLLAGCFYAIVAGTIYRQYINLPAMCTVGMGSRYFYLPQLIVLWLLLAALAGGGRLARLSLVALLLFAVSNVPRLKEPGLADLHWADYAPEILAGRAVVIPINPVGWSLSLPARQKALNSDGR
jgi:hypothetical protein